MADPTLIDRALAFAAGCDGADPAADSGRLSAAFRPYGLRFLASRCYRRPTGTFDSNTLWQAGEFVTLEAPDGWVGSDAQRYICFDDNPLIQASQQRRPHFRYSDYAPPRLKRWGRYYEAMSESGARSGLGFIAAGPGVTTASLSLGFETLDLSPAELTAIQLASLVFLDQLAKRQYVPLPNLSQRELDCLRFAATGLSDCEIAERLKISRATARAHADNARRKLGAVSRPQAVAKLAAAGLL